MNRLEHTIQDEPGDQTPPVIDPNTPDVVEPVDPYPVVDPPVEPEPEPEPFPTPPEPIPQYPPDVQF